MSLLLLKLTLVPFFLGLISVAGKRWGPSAAGWLAGLPVVVGPILFLLALQEGAAFAAEAAVSTLASLFSVIAFGVAYAWTARGGMINGTHGTHGAHSLAASRGWPVSTLSGLLAWAIAATIVIAVPLNVAGAFLIAMTTLIAAQFIYPPISHSLKPDKLPPRELAFRMLAGAALTLMVTSLAFSLGAKLSGVLSLFPVLTSVLAIFTHRNTGVDHAIALLRGLARGLFSLAGFCFALNLLLMRVDVATAFVTAIFIALLIQWLGRVIINVHNNASRF